MSHQEVALSCGCTPLSLLSYSVGDSTPLMEAASGGYADIVKLLIDHGANVNAKSRLANACAWSVQNCLYMHFYANCFTVKISQCTACV